MRNLRQGLFVWSATWLTAATLLATPLAAKSKPSVQLEPTGYAEVDSALTVGFNLPELTAAATGNNAAWQAALKAEQTRLAAVVRALGYLETRLSLESATRQGGSESTSRTDDQRDSAEVRLKPDIGPLYRIGGIEVLGLDDDSLADVRDDVGDLLAKYPGRVARGDVLSEIENEIIWRARNGSYAFAEVIAREIVPDRPTVTALVRITIATGPPLTFGGVTFDGLIRTDANELSSYLPFSAGDAYSVEALDALRRALERLSMLRAVRVAPGGSPDAAGRLPIEVQVREAPPDPQRLAQTGMMGMGLTAGALGLLGLRQLLSAAGIARHRLLREIDVFVFGLFIVAAQFGWWRVVELAGIG